MNISESTIQTKLNKKVDKIHGKGLSTNDFTDEYKNKVLSGTGGVGPQGEPGANGIDGTNGIDGINGTNGIDGTNGTDGYTPVKGVDYFDGIDGTNGSNGTNGTNGIDGYTPIKGVDYFDGADGTNGTNGTNGVDGADGAPGTTTWAGITDKPTIPTALADLSDDTTHRIVTDTEKSTWNSKQAGGTYSTDIHSNITALNAVSGTNTGNETSTTIKTALGITTLSGSNTGDETSTTIKTALGITTLSGSNTGDQAVPTALADLSTDTTHRTVTDTDKTTWNGKQNAGTYSTDIHANITALNAVSGTNTGDETTTTIKNKLGITTISGSNTGDETATTIKAALGITTLSGSNTGDNATNSQYSGLAASKQDALGFTAVPNTRTVNAKALSANVTLTPDDLNDTSTTHKFVASADITKLGNLSGTNTGDQTLSSLGIAGHIDGIGVSGNWNYKKYSDNTFEAFTVAAIASGTLTMTQIATSVMYASNTLTLTLPSIGITSVQHADLQPTTTSYVTNIAKNNVVGATVTYQVNKLGASTSSVNFTGKIYGTWA